MSIEFLRPEVNELKPRISVVGVGGAGGPVWPWGVELPFPPVLIFANLIVFRTSPVWTVTILSRLPALPSAVCDWYFNMVN